MGGRRLITGVSRYLETFSRHRIAVILPIVVALFISGWYATSQPAKYQATTTVWFDTAVPAPSSLDNPTNGGTTPAQEGQQVLQELLGTSQFLVKVGHRGPLASYLTAHPPRGKTGVSALFSKLISVVHKSSSATPSLNDQIVATLQKAFAFDPIGPQVLDVSMTSTNPGVMVGTLNALTAEYNSEIAAQRAARDTATSTYYQADLQDAATSLDHANAAVTGYLQAHPTASTASDPVFNQLVQAAGLAQTNYTSTKQALQQATLGLKNAVSASAFHVIDPAVAVSRLSNKKHEIFTVVAGLVAGMLISALAVSTLTAMDKTARREEDIEDALGVEVVASIRELPRIRRRVPVGRVKSS